MLDCYTVTIQKNSTLSILEQLNREFLTDLFVVIYIKDGEYVQCNINSKQSLKIN